MPDKYGGQKGVSSVVLLLLCRPNTRSASCCCTMLRVPVAILESSVLLSVLYYYIPRLLYQILVTAEELRCYYPLKGIYKERSRKKKRINRLKRTAARNRS